eukprot:Clim_evm7s56 gene=Clim_evmTU7s56
MHERYKLISIREVEADKREAVKDAWYRTTSSGFSIPREWVVEWLELLGDNMSYVVIDEDDSDKVVAICSTIDMGTDVRGVNVKTVGVTGVNVPIEARGKGVAQVMMTMLLRRLLSSEYTLASLFPSAKTLYRSVGFESFAPRTFAVINLKEFRLRPDMAEQARAVKGQYSIREFGMGLSLREILTAEDHQAVSRVHSKCVEHGNIVRGAYNWLRVYRHTQDPEVGRRYVLVHTETNEIRGYIIWKHYREPADRFNFNMDILDIGAENTEAWAQLLLMMFTMRSTAEKARLPVHACHPLLTILDEAVYSMEFSSESMLRILDVSEALKALSKGKFVKAALENKFSRSERLALLKVYGDEIFFANNGSWALWDNGEWERIDDSLANDDEKDDSKGLPTISLSLFEFTRLYNGHDSPEQMGLGAQFASVPLLHAMFTGPTPWHSEIF